MTPGRLLWLTRHFFRHGVRGAYGREVIGRRVLRCPPFQGLTDARAEIHVLTSREDWLPLVWMLRTFYRTSNRRYRLCIHDDGTVPPAGIAELRRQFPDARVIARADADARMSGALASAPTCHRYRTINPLLLKTFDFAEYLESDRLITLDSDILFFHAPTALLQRVEATGDYRNSFNRDWRYGYSILWDELAARAQHPVVSHVNSGIGVLRRGAVTPARCEEYFREFPTLPSHPHRIEQTLIALCAARDGYEMLPAEYDVHLGPTRFDRPMRHYTGPIRAQFYTEGMTYVWRRRTELLQG